MSDIQDGRQDTRIVRVNRFSVPADARDAFVGFLEKTHSVIRAQPGFIDDMILEQQSAAGIFSIIAIIRFDSDHALQPIIAAVARSDEAAGIDRQALTRRLGVETNVGFYTHVAASTERVTA